jgi:ribosomal protein S12 methylthiotransferase accessory factor
MPGNGRTVIVAHELGLRFAAAVGQHIVPTDQPVRSGGDDSAPTPLELLSVAVGSCVALYVHKYLETRHMPTEGVLVEVDQQTEPRPHRVSQFDVRILLPDSIPSLYHPIIESVARTCPVHNTLAREADFTIRVAPVTAPVG